MDSKGKGVFRRVAADPSESVCLSVYLSCWLSACLSANLSICLKGLSLPGNAFTSAQPPTHGGAGSGANQYEQGSKVDVEVSGHLHHANMQSHIPLIHPSIHRFIDRPIDPSITHKIYLSAHVYNIHHTRTCLRVGKLYIHRLTYLYSRIHAPCSTTMMQWRRHRLCVSRRRRSSRRHYVNFALGT